MEWDRVVNLINIFNPELIIIGDTLSLVNEILLPYIEIRICESALKFHAEDINLTVSAHEADAWVMGTVTLVLHDI